MDQNQTPRETGSELASHPTNVLHALAGPGLLRDSPPVQEAISVTRTAKARPHAATHSTDEFRLDDASGHADTDAEGARGQGLSATPEPAVEPLVAPEAPDAAEPLVEIKSEGSMRAGSESAGTLVGVGTERRPATAEQWAINLIALSNEAKAQQLLRTYAAKGVDAELVEMRRSRAGSTLFGLRIPGFATRREAVARSTDVKQKLGIKEVWIYQYANR
jgi:cell division septation protein DedD